MSVQCRENVDSKTLKLLILCMLTIFSVEMSTLLQKKYFFFFFPTTITIYILIFFFFIIGKKVNILTLKTIKPLLRLSCRSFADNINSALTDTKSGFSTISNIFFRGSHIRGGWVIYPFHVSMHKKKTDQNRHGGYRFWVNAWKFLAFSVGVHVGR
jgi:hypothetical protein